MKHTFIALSLFLVGCAHQRATEPVVVTHEVLVPIATKCKVERPVAPIAALLTASAKTGYYDKGVLTIKELEQWRSYAGLLEKALNACSDPPATQP